MSKLPLFGHAHRDQFAPAPLALVIDQYHDRDTRTRGHLRDDIDGDSSTGVYFPALTTGGSLDAPRCPRGGFGRGWIFDDVVRA